MRKRLDLVALVALYAVLTLPLLFTFKNGVYSVDEHKWHEPAIKLIYAHWPTLDVPVPLAYN